MKQTPAQHTDSQEDKAWIQAAKNNPDDFEFLFNKYHDRIFNFVLRRMYHEVIAQDITAGTFMKALEKIHQFEYKGIPFCSWLYRIAVNEINLYYRKRKRFVALTDERILQLAQEGFTDEGILQKEKQAETDHQFKKIHEAILKLKPMYQNAIALRYFEDKSIKEISEILDLSENTVKTHIRRGLHYLRRLL